MAGIVLSKSSRLSSYPTRVPPSMQAHTASVQLAPHKDRMRDAGISSELRTVRDLHHNLQAWGKGCIRVTTSEVP